MQAYLVAALRRAAKQCAVFALLRSGGAPGIMYCQGREDGVREWVATVQTTSSSRNPGPREGSRIGGSEPWVIHPCAA
ncbi:hypothetical protein P8C59_001595 [Phyllachora maydis]|uniref:Uncharacterized protein n=1 Tax=Phyllachora maydis TaxID=1825666 RepID=A0AAD9HYG4_9PEZI|nr:hypothetical protein P8C59_001595 [Phyllachora maydis]